LKNQNFDKKTRIIVVRFERENIGFVVDEVTQVVRINKSVIEPTPPLVGSIGQEYILGICKYDDRLIILLDIDMLVYENKARESQLKKLLIHLKALLCHKLIHLSLLRKLLLMLQKKKLKNLARNPLKRKKPY